MPPQEPNRTLQYAMLAIAIVAGLTVAVVPLAISVFGGSDSSSGPDATGSHAPSVPGTPPDNTSEGDLADVSLEHPRECPAAGEMASPHPKDSELAGVELPCLTQPGAPADLGSALAGKPTVVNVWAWWCGPCRAELPLFDQLAEQHPEWNVVGVHLDAKAQAGADFLEELGVDTMPSFQDSNHTFDATTGIPKVVPITLVYHADGTRAQMFARTFDDYDELQQAVHDVL